MKTPPASLRRAELAWCEHIANEQSIIPSVSQRMVTWRNGNLGYIAVKMDSINIQFSAEWILI